MGGICSNGYSVDSDPIGSSPNVNGGIAHGFQVVNQFHALPANVNRNSTLSASCEGVDKQLQDPYAFLEMNAFSHGVHPGDINDGIPWFSRTLSQKFKTTTTPKQASVAKVSEVSSLLGKVGSVGLGKAVDVLDTLGSSMTNLKPTGGFTSGATTKGNKITILAFEVANTIVKGANLMQSLSTDNIKHLKEEVLSSEAVQNLISKDMDELLRIAAADKREELKVFSGEVVRFGNRCKDPQWHNLDRYFENLGSESSPHRQLKGEAKTIMQQLMTMVHDTAELYHELHDLDRFEQDYRRKRQEEEDNLNPAQRGDSAIFKADIKSQKKHVQVLKKKSLWSKVLEEVMEKLVDIVHFLHLEIEEAFGVVDGDQPVKGSLGNQKKLGSAGLALHYANIITQIDNLVSQSSYVPSNRRDTLYQGLPPSIKSGLRSKLQLFEAKQEQTVQQIKAEMDKTLKWLVPLSTNTTKAHHGFGWVGEWANTGFEMDNKLDGQPCLICTLHHADRDRTEAYILELVIWLHHLVIHIRADNGEIKSSVKSPIRSPTQKTIQLSTIKHNRPSPVLTVEDKEMLREVAKRKKTPGISKSQEFDTTKIKLSKYQRLSKSSSNSPIMEKKNHPFPIRRHSSIPVIDFQYDRIKALDVIDRVDTIWSV